MELQSAESLPYYTALQGKYKGIVVSVLREMGL